MNAKEQDKIEAIKALSKWKGMRELVKCNKFGCHILIGEFNIGVCSNKKLLPVIDHNIREIKKFLKGKKNKWE